LAPPPGGPAGHLRGQGDRQRGAADGGGGGPRPGHPGRLRRAPPGGPAEAGGGAGARLPGDQRAGHHVRCHHLPLPRQGRPAAPPLVPHPHPGSDRLQQGRDAGAARGRHAGAALLDWTSAGLQRGLLVAGYPAVPQHHRGLEARPTMGTETGNARKFFEELFQGRENLEKVLKLLRQLLKALRIALPVIGFPMLAFGGWLALAWVPAERDMGAPSRIMYAHVPAVWMMFLCCVLNFGASIWYLAGKPSLKVDAMAEAGAEVCLVFGVIGVLLGSIW